MDNDRRTNITQTIQTFVQYARTCNMFHIGDIVLCLIVSYFVY